MTETGRLLTEQANALTTEMDTMSTMELLRVMNEEDRTVPAAVGRCLPEVAKAVDAITEAMGRGGRLFYVGAGTSGRLGVLDAYECPPTFGTAPGQVQALLAGGLYKTEADESAEDDADQGAFDLRGCGLRETDVVVGIAASGRTPYVLGALVSARTAGATTIAVSCNVGSPIGQAADIAIEVAVGPEVLTGSTRLKAGTAQKLVLNMLSTASMAKQGKVYRNLMVDMQATNVKLHERASRIVTMATGADDSSVQTAMRDSGGEVKTAIVMLLAGLSAGDARRALAHAGGRVRQAIAGMGDSSL